MKISALRLHNVKRFAGRGVAIEGIGDGVNVLCAANEFGKSTSFEALHALFFQPHTGTPAGVRRLRPYSGGSPLVETDIATPDGRFRITKQYYGGRYAKVTDLGSGRLIAQADEAENFIANLVRGGAASPAGLLWVRQGTIGIEKRDKSDEEGEKLARASLLESVQGEVEAVTGGRRMAEIMAATGEALAQLVTATGRPKTGGRYHAAIAERDLLVEKEGRLSGEVTVLRDALDQRASAEKQLAELDTEDGKRERRKAIDDAQACFDAAKEQAGLLKTAEAELALAQERWEAATRDLEAFRSASRKAAELGQRLRESERQRSEAQGRRRNAAETMDAARKELDAAEALEQEARDLLSRLDAALKARDAAERLAALKTRLDEAEGVREAIENAEAKRALEKMPPKAVAELQALDIEIATLRAARETARPSVSVVYERDDAAFVEMDGVPLMGGVERGYDGRARLILPGIGTMTLLSNRTVGRDEKLERAEANRNRLLASIGVTDLAAAREREVRAQGLEAELRGLRAQLAFLAPDGLPKLRQDVETHAALGLEALELKEDPERVRSALALAEERRKRARLALRETEPLKTSADEAFVAVETSLASLSADRAQAEASLGPEEGRGARESALSESLNDLRGRRDEAKARVETLRASAVDLEAVEARLRRARSADDRARAEIDTLGRKIAELGGRIATRADEAIEENWREAAEALAAAKARVAAFEQEIAVLQRLSSALDNARVQARELYLKPVMTELKPLLGLLFDDVAITFDDKTLLPQTILRNGQEEDVEHLSGGMREQLSVLTRLAFARLLARDGRPAPVILDDALVYSDDDRIERMFDALHRQSRDQQIIVFSCRQRAFQKLGGTILEMTDWTP